MMRKGDLAKMSAADRVKMVESLFVGYPRFDQIFNTIAYCHTTAKKCADVKGLFLKGPAGAGKTTIIKRYQKKFPRRETDEGTIVPVYRTAVPTPTTIKSLVSRMLWDLGDPIRAGTAVQQTMRLRKLINDCQVELIFIDEFQHFVDRDNQRLLLNTANWLKEVMDATRIPFVLCGLPYAERILEADSQLSRRFTFRQTLEPFHWDPNAKRQDIQDFLDALDRALPLAELSDLDDPDFARRILYATDGLVFYIMELIRGATEFAMQTQQEKITMDLLAQSFETFILARKPEKQNPFGDVKEVLTLFTETESPLPPQTMDANAYGQKAASNRGRKKKQKDNITDILKT